MADFRAGVVIIHNALRIIFQQRPNFTYAHVKLTVSFRIYGEYVHKY